MGKRILIAVGGTGGHLFPAQSLAKELQNGYEVDLLFVGGKLSENKWFNKDQFTYRDICCSTLSFRQGLQIFKNVLTIVKGVSQSIETIKNYNPDLVIAFGSFHTLPTLLAALFQRKKIYLHEQNKSMGRVNRFFSRFSKKVMISFPKTIPHNSRKNILVKMPLKFDPLALLSQVKCRQILNLDPKLKTILVCGGSQGAVSINQHFLKSLEYLKGYSFQVIHITGFYDNFERIKEEYSKKNIAVYLKRFDEDMHILMQASDFVISRAGASMVAELIELELPSLLVPYPHAGGHQEHNADFVQDEVKGGLKIVEKNLSGDFLAKLIVNFFNDENIQQYRHDIEIYKKQSESCNFAKIISLDLGLNEKR